MDLAVLRDDVDLDAAPDQVDAALGPAGQWVGRGEVGNIMRFQCFDDFGHHGDGRAPLGRIGGVGGLPLRPYGPAHQAVVGNHGL